MVLEVKEKALSTSWRRREETDVEILSFVPSILDEGKLTSGYARFTEGWVGPGSSLDV